MAVARWLACRGVIVTVTDLADPDALAEPLAQLASAPIARYALGGHCEEDFRECDLLVVNPAVRPGNPFVQMAAEYGARVTTEIDLFLQHCPATVIGVTGSNGKSTTTAMIDCMLRADGRTSWLGGNVGRSLLPQLSEIQADHWVVLELSSFQLWRFSQATCAPHIAVVTSFTPNHLDWHLNYADYRDAKQRILSVQKPEDSAVLNTHDAEVANWASCVRGTCVALPSLDRIPPLRVPGQHNRINAACAWAAARAAGCREDEILQALEPFRGLPERLEFVATLDGVEIYNDSSSTTPESTLAAILAIDRPVWLIAGGKNKGLSYTELLQVVVKRCRGAAFFGATRDRFCKQAIAHAESFPCIAVESLQDALAWCSQRARAGDAIVFSPACSSHDQFRNYRHRSDVFRGCVASLTKRGNR